jgi:hypothetical protein
MCILNGTSMQTAQGCSGSLTYSRNSNFNQLWCPSKRRNGFGWPGSLPNTPERSMSLNISESISEVILMFGDTLTWHGSFFKQKMHVGPPHA